MGGGEHFNPLGIKSQIHLSKLEKSSILREKWAIEFQRPIEYSLLNQVIIDCKSFHCYAVCI